ncbi:hypothetical protein [Nocardioides piscis]|nr:hypothetical protein [Nocardioides piscis]
MLDRLLVVPALRQDGSEIDIRMWVSATPLPRGGSIFVADLQAL